MARLSAMHWSMLSKGQAFAIHLTLSLLIFSSLVFMMIMFWFPGELFLLDGGWQGLKLVALVDLVLGPVLTLLLYKPGKPKLILDMSLIATFQIVALAYGFVTTHQQRTVAMVYAEGGFNSLSAVAHRHANAQLIARDITPQWVSEIDSAHPAILLTPAPTGKSFGKYLADLLNGYPEPHERSDKFLTLASGHESIQKFARDAESLQADGDFESVQPALKQKNQHKDDVELYNFKTRYAQGIAILDPLHMKIVDYVPIELDTVINPDETVADSEID